MKNIVSIHDVAPPFFDRVRRMVDELSDIGVQRRSLLVIPNYHGQWPIDQHPEFCRWLQQRQTRGDEIILHGYEHIGIGTPKTFSDRFKNRWGTVGEGEFLCLIADAVFHKKQGGARQQPPERHNQMLQGVFFCGSILWSTQVTHKNHATAIVENFSDRGNGCSYPRVVSHVKFIIQRYIEVNTNQCSLPGKIV